MGDGRGTTTGTRGGRANSIDMLHGPLLGKIVAFSIPLALASILQQLFNSTDAMFAGQFVGSTALAAIGGVMPVISLLIGLFLGLSMGSNVTIAMRVGRGDERAVRSAVHTSFSVALICSVALTIVGLLVTEPILDAMAIPGDARAEAGQYLRIYFGGIAFFQIYDFSAAILRSKGDTRRPLYALAVAAVANAALDYAAVAAGTGVVGIALGTVAANGIAGGMLFWFLLHEEGAYRLDLRELALEPAAVKSILHIGLPSGVQGMIFSFSNVIIQSEVNGFGTAGIAGSAAATNFEYYSYFFINAFAQAAVTFVGQNFAAGKLERCDAIMRRCVAGGVVVSAAFCFLVILFSSYTLGIFTHDPAALGFAHRRLWCVLAFDFMIASYEVTASGMRGMGWAVLPTIVTVFGTCVLRLVYVLGLFPLVGSFEMLLAVYPISWLITGSAMIALFFWVRKQAFATARA